MLKINVGLTLQTGVVSVNGFWSQFETYVIGEGYQVGGFLEQIGGKIREEFSDYPDYHPAILGEESGTSLYSLVRKVKPEVIIETGVCNGFSTSLILKAMEDCGKGKLFSVDLPTTIDEVADAERTAAVIPPGREPGWAVPEELKERWSLTTGDTFQVLPEVFNRLGGEIDIFLHDSGHSYETMMFEFCLAWRNLKADGYLLADNVDLNDAFLHFTEGKGLPGYKLADMGLIVKGVGT